MEKTLRELTEELTLRDERLMESEKMFRTAFCMNPIPMVITDQIGTLIKVNQAFTEVSGYEEEEVLGKTMFEMNIYINEEDRKRLIDTVNRDVTAKKVLIDYRHKNGNTINTEITTKLIKIKGTDHFLSVIEDVTERRYYKRKQD